MSARISIAAFLALIALHGAALAASLQVSPVSVEAAAPAATAAVTLANTGTEVINAQIRVLKWNQAKGADELVKTKDVVASPPAIKLQPGKRSVIRIVRLSKTPVSGEDTYRLLIDELPTPAKSGQVAVNLAIRYSIPVFFTAEGTAPKLSWKAAVTDGKLFLLGDNSGGSRAQIVDLKIVHDGKPVPVAEGLAGYVLAGSRRQWVVNQESIKFEPGGTIKIQALSNNVPFETTAKISAAN